MSKKILVLLKKRKAIKILYLGNFYDFKREGFLTLFKDLMDHFSKKNKVFLNEVSKAKKVDIIHLHSSGFFEVIKFRDIPGKKIYSLYSNIVPNYFKSILDVFQGMALQASRSRGLPFLDRFIKKSCYIISQFIPVFVKRYYLHQMDLVILPNKWLANKLKLRNSRVIHQGIDVAKFRKLKHTISKKINVCYFGHPSASKGIIELIKACSKLDEKFNKKFFFTFSNNNLIRFVKSRDSSIKVHGPVNNIVEEYNKGDIIILPYRHHIGAIATPLTLIEAMACERAIITTDLPHLREICGDAVYYVKPYSVGDIVKGIEYLAKNKKLRITLGKKARKRIVCYYNQKKMFQDYQNLYNTFISS